MLRTANQLTVKSLSELCGGKGVTTMTQLLNDGEFAGKGKLFSVCTLKPGASVGKHAHNGDFEVYYMLSGEARYTDNAGSTTTLHPGDVTICPDGESHAIENSGNTDMSFVALILCS